MMKKIALLIWVLLLHTACETGTRYDKNSTKMAESESSIVDDLDDDIEVDSTHSDSYYIDQGEDNYEDELASMQPEEIDVHEILDEEGEEEVTEESTTQDTVHFEGGAVANGLNLFKVRRANHDSYIRLVFDSKGSSKVGSYSVDYNPNDEVITMVLDGYSKFAGTFPTFERNSIVEKIYFAKHQKKGSYKLHIKLREDTKMTTFALDTPARLVIDVKKP